MKMPWCYILSLVICMCSCLAAQDKEPVIELTPFSLSDQGVSTGLLAPVCEVPPGTTKEAYYGSSVLQGPKKKWKIRKPYAFEFTKQVGDTLYFRFTHNERIPHAFFTNSFENGVLEPRNPGFDVYYDGVWKQLARGGCYFGVEARLLKPRVEYVVKIPLWFGSIEHNATARLKAVINTGCWLAFESTPFEVHLPFVEKEKKGEANLK